MTKEEYLDNLFEAFNKGEISEEAYWQGFMNIDDFCDEN